MEVQISSLRTLLTLSQ
jgi:SP family sugar:H+ symporter-like MFS transporter